MGIQSNECEHTPSSKKSSLEKSSSTMSNQHPPNKSSSSPGHRKSVSFSQFLEIRQHALTIGDHPSCRDSLPLSLDWEHADTLLMDIDDASKKKKKKNKRLSYKERKEMLRQVSGLTEADDVRLREGGN